MITVKVSDLREMVEDLERENIKYAVIEYLEMQNFKSDIIPTFLQFNAYDSLGYGMNFGSIEHLDFFNRNQ